jgi:hypothetical protein
VTKAVAPKAGGASLALALACCAEQAPSQGAERWTSPKGQISIDFAAHGLEVLDRASPDAPYMDSDIVVARQAGGSVVCEVTAHSAAEPPRSRAQLNASTRAVAEDDPEIAKLRSDPAFRFSFGDVDGVLTIDTEEHVGTTLFGVNRRFTLHHDGQMHAYALLCSANRANESDVAVARAVAQSLRLGPAKD